MKLIGVDIGGTKITAGLIVDGKIERQSTSYTPSDQPKNVVVDAVIKQIENVYDPGVEGIGIGVPGLVDLEENVVIDVTNIPSWDVVPLRSMVEKYFGKPAYVNNDANCFAVGEKHFGKGRPYSNFVGVTIGTGLGAGIIINNHLYSGRFCGAGEFGNIYYRDSNIENYCSGQFFANLGFDGKMMAQQAASGGREALALFDEFGGHLGRGLANILFALAPEAIILGGSASRSYPYFRGAMEAYFESVFPFQRLYRSLKIEISDTENMAVLGASSLVLDAIS